MRAAPSDLEKLGGGIFSQGAHTAQAGWMAAFLQICKSIEPNLVPNDDDRVVWIESLATIELKLTRIPIDGYDKPYGIAAGVFSKLIQIAKTSWRGPSKDVREIPFVKNPELRAIAERDLASLSNLQKAEETKCALILAGSVIEAILFDLIEGNPTAASATARTVKAKTGKANPRAWAKFNSNDFQSWTLEQAVAVCGPDGLGVLSERSTKMAHLVRDFRNYVHPRKERDQMLDHAPLVSPDAVQCVALMESVIDQVMRWRAANP